MTIDIESLSYRELLELKQIIDQRIEVVRHLQEEKGLKGFEPGDHVNFTHPRFGRQKGTLLKFNTNTVTVVTTSGQKWDVTPHLLKKIVRSRSKENGKTPKIVTLPSNNNRDPKK